MLTIGAILLCCVCYLCVIALVIISDSNMDVGLGDICSSCIDCVTATVIFSMCVMIGLGNRLDGNGKRMETW